MLKRTMYGRAGFSLLRARVLHAGYATTARNSRKIQIPTGIDKVLRVLRPLGIDAAVKALAAQVGEVSAAQRQLELALAAGALPSRPCASAI
jgi:hypothetical protein